MAKTDTDATIKRNQAPSTPNASDVEKTKTFTAAFGSDAHAAADHWLGEREEVKREETDAGHAGAAVTVTYK